MTTATRTTKATPAGNLMPRGTKPIGPDYIPVGKFRWLDWIAWEMFDGRTMTGRVHDGVYDTLSVIRCDGGWCSVAVRDARLATDAEVLESTTVFTS